MQIQDTGHQEADAEHQQEQDSHAPRTEDTWSLQAGPGEVCPRNAWEPTLPPLPHPVAGTQEGAVVSGNLPMLALF